ncbi:mitochondrial basic amino acids transporter-like [Onthophagus taurus]|uniref:mitochondrial basic amino acids transporter-like n=1 Tax=Onthophagus taurus TaxID=166361 RepID=UPI0039BE8C2B
MDFIAGCLGGCAGVIVGHPLDTVKVHLQVQSPTSKYNTTYKCLRGIIIKDGFKGLYRGMSSPLVGVSGINAIIFGVYGITQRYISQDNSIFSHFIAGGMAGFCQSILTGPVELAKSRAQILGNVSATQCIKKIFESEGFKGVFRGLNITVMREIPAFGSYFASYEYLSRMEDGITSTPTMILAGGTAGVISWIISYPIDVIKSRMQIDGMNGINEYKNSMDCLKKTVEQGGYRSLFRGLMPAIIRAFPVNAACFTVVTWTMRVLNDDLVIEHKDNTLWDGGVLYSTVVYNMQTQEPVVA